MSTSGSYVYGWSDPRMPQFNQPDYYVRRHYGKYTIYNREGETVAHGLNKEQMENYMKLLKKED